MRSKMNSNPSVPFIRVSRNDEVGGGVMATTELWSLSENSVSTTQYTEHQKKKKNALLFVQTAEYNARGDDNNIIIYCVRLCTVVFAVDCFVFNE